MGCAFQQPFDQLIARQGIKCAKGLVENDKEDGTPPRSPALVSFFISGGKRFNFAFQR
jgi:hypothetical protein